MYTIYYLNKKGEFMKRKELFLASTMLCTITHSYSIPKIDAIRNTIQKTESLPKTTLADLLKNTTIEKDAYGNEHRIISNNTEINNTLTSLEQELNTLYWTNNQDLINNLALEKDGSNELMLTLIYSKYAASKNMLIDFVKDLIKEEEVITLMPTRILKAVSNAPSKSSTPTANMLFELTKQKQMQWDLIANWANKILLYPHHS